ncbi:MAG TPA: hypothetical protein VF691_06040, partial [Cytophagaceae bacterium]
MDHKDQKIAHILNHRLDEVPLQKSAKNSFELLQVKIAVKKFYYFHPRQFNIYYAVALLSCVITTSVLGIHYIYNQKDINTKVSFLEEAIKSRDNAINTLSLKIEALSKTNASISYVKPKEDIRKIEAEVKKRHKSPLKTIGFVFKKKADENSPRIDTTILQVQI